MQALDPNLAHPAAAPADAGEQEYAVNPPSEASARAARSLARRLEWRGIVFVVALFLALRLYFSLVGALTFSVAPPEWANVPEVQLRGIAPLGEGPAALWLGVWVRWDANWYLEIATEGYEAGDGSVVFPPLLPLLARGVGALLGGDPLPGALLVANVACLAALLLFHRLVRLDEGEATARRALLWLALFPTSFYLFVPYTESLYLTLVLGAFLSVRTGRWPLAILLGALAAVTRVPGALLTVPLVLELAHEPLQRWWRLKRIDAAELRALALRALPAALIPGALGLYAAYAYVVVGDHLLWKHLETLWELHWAPPWVGLLGDARFVLDPPTLVGDAPVPWINEGTNRTGPLVDLIVGVLFAGLGLVGLVRLRPSYSAYFWLMLLSGMTKVDAYDLTQSLARYVLVIFPGFLLLGLVPLPRWLGAPLIAAAVLVLGGLVAAFVHWWWLW